MSDELNDKQMDDKSSEDRKSSSEDESDLPPLEDIKYDDKSDESIPKKNIVIPEDDKKEKQCSDGWLDVLDNGELRKFVLTPGAVGEPRPERGCLVVIKLVTKLSETEEVVESESFDSIDIVLGDSDLIQGLDLVIPLMDQKEVARVVIKSRFAYGKAGKGDEIPPNASLDCELHLLSVQWIDEEFVLPIDDRIRIGNRKKERGNFWFLRQDFSTSIQCYKSAIKFLDASEEELASDEDNALKQHFDQTMKGKSAESSDPIVDHRVEELVEIRSTAYNNLAIAQMKIEDFNGALKSVDAVLIIQPNNVKALYRKGKIWAQKGELDSGIESLKKAMDLEPENKAIGQELAKYRAKRKAELVTERDLYKRMLELDTNSSKQSKGIEIISSDKKWMKWSLIGGAVTASLAVASALTYKFIQ